MSPPVQGEKRRLREFEQALHSPNSAPEDLALLIAREEKPDLDIARQLALLDEIAQHVERRVQNVAPGRSRAEWFLSVFTEELGFSGNLADYGAVENSLLDVVLERRRGLPIMLCLVCHAVGRRIGVQIDGLGFPGHFMARYRDEAGEWILDPFHALVLDMDDVEAHLIRVLGKGVRLSAEHFTPFLPIAWAQRILNNLHNAWLARGDQDKAAGVLEYMIVLAPSNPQLWRERSLLLHHALRWEESVHDLRRYFFLRGQFSLVLGSDVARDQLLAMLSAQDQQLFAIYQKLTALVGRIN